MRNFTGGAIVDRIDLFSGCITAFGHYIFIVYARAHGLTLILLKTSAALTEPPGPDGELVTLLKYPSLTKWDMSVCPHVD